MDRKLMITVPRTVRVIAESNEAQSEIQARPIPDYRDHPAWVLLGEPGAGKTEALKAEAEQVGGYFCRVAEFVEDDDLEHLRGKTLFLDGLDEVRASDSSTLLPKIGARLRKLGNPGFRLSCRAADWHGATDRSDLTAYAPGGELLILQLDPLTTNDIVELLRRNHDIADPDSFISEARRRGIDPLLENPQTLELLAKSVTHPTWPETRTETFDLACRKLVEEPNARHRTRERSAPTNASDRIEAAGQLCASLLLADKTGIALDPNHADARFPMVSDFQPQHHENTLSALRSPLFLPEGEDRLVPKHRSIAEYLAARWLAGRIDRKRLSLKRLLNLLTGDTDGTVAGLRGLYAWLASLSTAARNTLMEIDPITVILYGDPQPMPASEKRLLLSGIFREIDRYGGGIPGADIGPALPRLWDSALSDDFLRILENPDRSQIAQIKASYVIDILRRNKPTPALVAALKTMVCDHSRWPGLRRIALKTWLESASPDEALSILNDIREGRLDDPDDGLAGTLLPALYPAHLAPALVIEHLHKPKREHHFGSYYFFYGYHLPEKAPTDHLPVLLNSLADKAADIFHSPYPSTNLSGVIGKLLVRALTEAGDQIDDTVLCHWLGIGVGRNDTLVKHGRESVSAIRAWFENHPNRYMGVLDQIFKYCESHDDPAYCIAIHEGRLLGATPPPTIGEWHLSQASSSDTGQRARLHLEAAIRLAYDPRSDTGLTLDRIYEWGQANLDKQPWLGELLVCPISELRQKLATHVQEQRSEFSRKRHSRTLAVAPHLHAIYSGVAPPDLLHQLAGVWEGLYHDVPGQSLKERFDNYTENGSDVLAAAQAGFRQCPLRPDLPTAQEVIELCSRQKQHYIARPCLIGMELLWQDDPALIREMDDDVLGRMLAFRLAIGTGNTPAWFNWMAHERPARFADVLVEYAASALKARLSHVDGLYALEHDPAYKAVAKIAVPRLLDAFPPRAKKGHMQYLVGLLKSSLRHNPHGLAELVRKKVSLKSLEPVQKTYWLTAGLLINPAQYEENLWDHVGRSDVRAEAVMSLLSDDWNRLVIHDHPSIRTIGILIERLCPIADFDNPEVGTAATERGRRIRTLISGLASIPTDDARNELLRLLRLPSTRKVRQKLEQARHEQAIRQRERQFRFLPLESVATILSDQASASVSDLAALTTDLVDDIARSIRQDNDDGFRAFWNVHAGHSPTPRDENLCRDVLLSRMRPRLDALGISAAPEADHHNDQRADIEVAYRNLFSVPVEIKRDSNKALWTGLREQLVGKYLTNPRCGGYGLYVVLWFGDARHPVPRATDGGKRPQTPEELETRLRALLTPTEQRTIFVRVIDVSWPIQSRTPPPGAPPRRCAGGRSLR